MKKGLILFLSLIVVFVSHTLISTGYFRTVNGSFSEHVLARVALVGAEDIVVSDTHQFAIISATDRRIYPPKEQEHGGLYLIDLEDPNLSPFLLDSGLNSPFAPHGIDMIPDTDSTFQILAINHVGKSHRIEQFQLQDRQLTHIKTWQDSSMIQPNDVVWIHPNEFYFTNDHGYTAGLGKLIEEYGGFAWSNVIHVNQGNFQEVADGIAYANGIAYDPRRELLYVASPRGFLVKVYQRNPEGSLVFLEDLPCRTGVDNITINEKGHLWIGAHPNLLRFQAYAKGKYKHAPSEIIRIQYNGLNNYIVESKMVDDGRTLSGSTVAVPYKNQLLVGNVMDDSFVILIRE